MLIIWIRSICFSFLVLTGSLLVFVHQTKTKQFLFFWPGRILKLMGMKSCNMLSSFCHKTYRKMIKRQYFLNGLEFRKINATLLLSFLNTDISSLKNNWIQCEMNCIETKITLFAPYKILLHGNACTWTMPMISSAAELPYRHQLQFHILHHFFSHMFLGKGVQSLGVK